MRRQGAKGGRISGKRSLEAINAAKRTARATKAIKAARGGPNREREAGRRTNFALPPVMSLERLHDTLR
jgi:hypothetical protein